MTYVANSSTSAISAYRGNLHHQSQQTPWTFNNEESRTAVTSSLPISEATEVQIVHGVDIHKMYRERLSETSQVTPVSMVNWHFLINWEVLPSSPEAFQDLVKTLPAWRERSTSAFFLSETQLEEIERFYVFRNDSEVKHTLREYAFLTRLLLDTHNKIEAHFPGSQAFLEVAYDYEAFDQYPGLLDSPKELVVTISTSLSPEEAMKNFKKFYDSWWSIALKDTRGKISVGLEFL